MFLNKTIYFINNIQSLSQSVYVTETRCICDTDKYEWHLNYIH